MKAKQGVKAVKGGEPPGRGARGGGARSPIDAGFDRWLDKQLHRLYDPVLNEDVPDDIARLIEGFAERPRDDEDHGGGTRG